MQRGVTAKDHTDLGYWDIPLLRPARRVRPRSRPADLGWYTDRALRSRFGDQDWVVTRVGRGKRGQGQRLDDHG